MVSFDIVNAFEKRRRGFFADVLSGREDGCSTMVRKRRIASAVRGGVGRRRVETNPNGFFSNAPTINNC